MRKTKRENKFIRIFEGVDLSKRRTPLMILKSSRPGPVIWLCGAIHGDEVNGIEVIHRIFDVLEAGALTCGSVYAIPVMNPLGFEMISRDNPYDEEDLNRQFIGDPHGSTAERMASVIYSTIAKTKPAFVLDLHTDSSLSVAYIIVDRLKKPKDDTTLKKTVEITEKLGLPWAYDYEDHAGYPLEKSLSGALVANGIPAVTAELGGPYVISPYFVEKGILVVRYLLSHFNMIRYSALPVQPYFRPPILRKPLRFYEEIRSEKSGIVIYKVTPGQLVRKGQSIAKIKNALGKTVEIIKSPQKALVLSLSDQSVSFPGSNLFTLAVEDRLKS